MAPTARMEARKRERFTRGMGGPRWDRPSPFVVCHASRKLTDDKRRSSVPPLLGRHSSRASKNPLEELSRAAADVAESDIQGLLVEARRSPALDQFGEHLKLGLRSRQAAFGVSGGEALTVIEGAIEGGSVAQKIGVFGREVSHLLDDFDACRGVQDLIKNPRPAEPQIHQGEVDIIIAPHAGLEGIPGALLALQAGAHLAEFVAGGPALALAPPAPLPTFVAGTQ